MAIERFLTKNKLTTELEASATNSKTKRRTGFKWAFAASILLILYLVAINTSLIAILITAIALYLLLAALFSARKSVDDNILQAGAEGEDIAVALARQLPNQYVLFNQVDIPSKKSRTGFREADLIVAGPDCVFVVEIKHNNGYISGREFDRNWRVIKTGRGGTDYEKQIRNPVKQVKQQVWLLSQFLKNQKANAWIQPVVLFTNDSVRFDVETESIPVLGKDNFLGYILGYKNARARRVTRVTDDAIASLKFNNSNHDWGEDWSEGMGGNLRINPANGLPMMGPLFDAAGNVYGDDESLHDDFHQHHDHHDLNDSFNDGHF